MTVLIVPELTPGEGKEWPSLGPQICDFLEERSVYGPGSLKGEPYRVDPEFRAILIRGYQLYPRGHRLAGRRRFKRVAISWRKGLAKTEKAGEVAFCELHPEGPVRFGGWDANGNPVGRPVRDPYIPMVAYDKEQVQELAYGALFVICSESPDADFFDIGLDRILRLDARGRTDGKAVSVSGSPNAADGARTTFQHFDETHRMELPRLINAHNTMLENIPKRPLDDPWTLETTTAGKPGANSVAEGTHREAQAILRGEIKDPSIFYFHREAGAHHKLDTVEHRVAGIAEATGPVGEYGPGQFEEIARTYDRPKVDKSYWERVWFNRWIRGQDRAFDVVKFTKLADGFPSVKPGSFVTLGFDGARFRDATALVITDIPTGRQMPVGLWERPDVDETVQWEVPEAQVQAQVEWVFKTFKVWKFYADPPHWFETVGKWAGRWPDQVVEWHTNRIRPMGMAVMAFKEAINSALVTVGGDPEAVAAYVTHVGNAGKKDTNLFDDEGNKVVILTKVRPDVKFDQAMAGVLSWQARLDALAAGATAQPDTFVPYRVNPTG